MKETELFQPIKTWLEERGFDVYAEVSGVGGRADVVGKMGKSLVCIELKVQLSFELLSQAIDRKNYFHYVYIAIPKRRTPIPRLVYDLLHREGIGLITISGNYAQMDQRARFNRPPYHHRIDWDHLLRSEYKQHLGGDNGSHLMTPYKLLMTEVRRYLVMIREADKNRALHGGASNGGWVSIDDILEHCEADRHYASPRPSLSQALRTFEITWCEIKKEKGKLYYRAKEGIKRRND